MNDAPITDSTQMAGPVIHPPYRVFVLSWLAYIRPCVVLVCFGMVCGLTAAFFPLVGKVMLLATLALFVYQILEIRSIKIFTDEDGVWVYSGVFPWNKGLYGVKWSYLNEATFKQGFISWMFKSYNIRLTNRYTADNEITLPHVKKGDEAVSHINRLHLDKLEAEHVPSNRVAQG
ncbi:MAG TPA: hypothetical protein ACQGQH_09050 [Xylella sp.]